MCVAFPIQTEDLSSNEASSSPVCSLFGQVIEQIWIVNTIGSIELDNYGQQERG